MRYLDRSVGAEVLTQKEMPIGHPFEQSLGIRADVEPLVSRLASLVSRGASLVLHDRDARSYHPDLWDTWVVFHGDEVYHFVPPFAKSAEIREAVMEAETGNGMVGVVVAPGGVCQVPESRGSKVTGEQIESWSDNASHIIVGICDGETYLIWPADSTPGKSEA